jgi:hypothetical protein
MTIPNQRRGSSEGERFHLVRGGLNLWSLLPRNRRISIRF